MSNDDLPRLKAYMLEGPMRFQASEPLTWIKVQATKDTHELFVRLMRWMDSERVFPVRFGGGGGYAYEAGFAIKDGARVLAWLREHGADEKRW